MKKLQSSWSPQFSSLCHFGPVTGFLWLCCNNNSFDGGILDFVDYRTNSDFAWLFGGSEGETLPTPVQLLSSRQGLLCSFYHKDCLRGGEKQQTTPQPKSCPALFFMVILSGVRGLAAAEGVGPSEHIVWVCHRKTG